MTGATTQMSGLISAKADGFAVLDRVYALLPPRSDGVRLRSIHPGRSLSEA